MYIAEFECTELRGRTLDVERAFEIVASLYPTRQLSFSGEGGAPRRLQDRSQYVAQQLGAPRKAQDGVRSIFISDDDVNDPLIVSLMLDIPTLGTRAYSQISLQLPEGPNVDQLQELLGRIGDLFVCWHGRVSKSDDANALHIQDICSGNFPESLSTRFPGMLPLGIGPLEVNPTFGLTRVPRILGWMNFFSAEACRLFEFPSATTDLEWMDYAVPTSAGGYAFRLTDEPLNMLRDDHRETLKRAYKRFSRAWVRGKVATLPEFLRNRGVTL